jgi:hypothetical protein
VQQLGQRRRDFTRFHRSELNGRSCSHGDQANQSCT